MTVKDIEIGTKLELELFDEDGEKITPIQKSQFEWAQDETVAVIAAPIYEGVVFPVHINTKMNVYFIQKDNLFKFSARVASRGVKDNLAFLRIEATGSIDKIQRREFFRFDCTVPVKFRVVESVYDEENKKDQFKDAVTRDLSGGGLCIKVEEDVKMNSIIECELILGEKKSVRFYGKVVKLMKRPEEEKYKLHLGVIYKKIDNREREAIIRYIFEEQRKMRRRGLI